MQAKNDERMTIKEYLTETRLRIWAWTRVLLAWLAIIILRILAIPVFIFVSVLISVFNVFFGLNQTSIALETLAEGLKKIRK